jgi:type VI secretion system protein ImpH
MKYSMTEEPFRFEFFRAIRILECMYPGREPVGASAHPSREVVRFGAHVTLSFPASEIQSFAPAMNESVPPRMMVNFMGLAGPLGVLPLPYTEFLLQRISQKDNTLRDFLDLFNHRAISLFYRAWEKYRLTVNYERSPGEDQFSQYLSSLVGQGTKGLRGRLAFEDLALLHYSGLFNQRPHSAGGLEGIARNFFNQPVRVIQFVGIRVRLGAENHSMIGIQNSELGVNSILGEKVWDCQSRFRVRLGPLTLKAFRTFLPGSALFLSLVQIVRLYAGLEFGFDVQLSLKAPEVPACQLLSEGEQGAYLGWSSWLKTKEFYCDPEDAVISQGACHEFPARISTN